MGSGVVGVAFIIPTSLMFLMYVCLMMFMTHNGRGIGGKGETPLWKATKTLIYKNVTCIHKLTTLHTYSWERGAGGGNILTFYAKITLVYIHTYVCTQNTASSNIYVDS